MTDSSLFILQRKNMSGNLRRIHEATNPQKAPCCCADQISRDDIPRIMNASENPDSCNTGGEQQEYHAQENILPENTH